MISERSTSHHYQRLHLNARPQPLEEILSESQSKQNVKEKNILWEMTIYTT